MLLDPQVSWNGPPTNAVGSDGFQGGSAEAGPTAGFDPVLISLIRRSMPNLIAYDLAGVQPMSGPTGLDLRDALTAPQGRQQKRDLLR